VTTWVIYDVAFYLIKKKIVWRIQFPVQYCKVGYLNPLRNHSVSNILISKYSFYEWSAS